jgi:F-type H+-transporting ATPase subunit epsilon
MAEKFFECSVITPEGVAFEGEVTSAIMPAHDGQIGILFNRAPLVCKLGAGRLRLQTMTEEHDWFIDGGFAQVLDNHVSVLTQTALRPEEISREKAEAALAEATQMPAKDEVSARRKGQAMASARAQLRMAK